MIRWHVHDSIKFIICGSLGQKGDLLLLELARDGIGFAGQDDCFSV